MAVFITDLTFTLIRRFMRGEKVYLAHRSHGYQRATQRHQSHLKVSLAIGAINLLWLAPLAALVKAHGLAGPSGFLIAYSPILMLCLYYGSGTEISPTTPI